MAKKNERELKVCAMSGYNYKSVPAIRLMGQWLEAAMLFDSLFCISPSVFCHLHQMSGQNFRYIV